MENLPGLNERFGFGSTKTTEDYTVSGREARNEDTSKKGIFFTKMRCKQCEHKFIETT